MSKSLIDLKKKAAVSLTKSGLGSLKAAVYLVLDHSMSMQGYYGRGDVQTLATQTLGLALNLDDDGKIPVVFFANEASPVIEAHPGNYSHLVQDNHVSVRWGGTDYEVAMQAIVDHYQGSGSTDPALVVFQTDGSPYARDKNAPEEARESLRVLSQLPMFWAFVGFGPKENMAFLTELDDLSGRVVDNAGFFHAPDPQKVQDSDLYDWLSSQFAEYLGAARRAGVLR